MFTRHGSVRCQQRAISQEVVDVLLTYGNRRYRQGAEVCFMDHKSRAEARLAMGAQQFAKISDRLDKYAVLSNEGALITAAPRRRRLKF